MLEVIGRWVNWVLVANSFLIFFGFAWFVVGLLGRSLDIPLGFDLWLRLWEPFFTPALGLFMGGAILSGILGQVKKRWPGSSQPPKV
ncbi:hypothetical protein [Synechococcus sp. PCC 6312]|uniref:hypothetical protein n=1 Tax=Synechococcus sp. (strain ATCC 27167 / PCC 6312) TaxID=195253 RepID=UPI00029F3CC4|nr:hypothetical protein [Synechococcus sp. PCC 6312]AFY62424.1 hypothetical protein Syn6312_3396 [Synechococcus sp. PCC 6312]